MGLTGFVFAAAFWQSGGTTTGDAQLIKPLRVNQTADLASVSPGVPAQTLSGTFENLNGQPVHVTTVHVSIGAVTKAPGAAAGTCGAGDFTLRHRSITVDADVPSGRGTGAWTGGTIAFNNKPGIDQNACQGASVKLAYTTA